LRQRILGIQSERGELATVFGDVPSTRVEVRVLPQSKCRVAEEMVDAEKLGKGSRIRISRLAGEHRIPETLVVLIHDLL
jgi:hypothetical protein